MNKLPSVYILASGYNGTLYTGVTSNLIARIAQHKDETLEGFTSTYNVKNLVYFEMHNEMEIAIEREKQLKKWNRAWKINLIEKSNPHWKDLYEDLIG